jgi:hypothetical protein
MEGGSAPRREFHAYTDPAAGAIDQWRGVIHRAYKKPAAVAGFPFSFNRTYQR